MHRSSRTTRFSECERPLAAPRLCAQRPRDRPIPLGPSDRPNPTIVRARSSTRRTRAACRPSRTASIARRWPALKSCDGAACGTPGGESRTMAEWHVRVPYAAACVRSLTTTYARGVDGAPGTTVAAHQPRLLYHSIYHSIDHSIYSRGSSPSTPRCRRASSARCCARPPGRTTTRRSR